MQNEEESLEYRDVPDWVLEAGSTSLIASREAAALVWLSREIKVSPEKVADMLLAMRQGEFLYSIGRKPKRDGSWRRICAPNKRLKSLQRKVNRYLRRSWKPARNAFGFSGGSITDALQPHLKNKTMLCVDLVEAFPSITFENVFDHLLAGRTTRLSLEWVESEQRYRRRRTVNDYGYFSWYAARIFAELVTFERRLPQGAPTSPRVFDLVCELLDKSLQKLAAHVGGTYTRYADNMFFSIHEDSFPLSLRNAILKRIEGKRLQGLYFSWHKLRIVSLKGEAVRALGLNILKGEIHNTRSFKRRVRLSVHHVAWLLDHGMNYEEAWQRLQGQMQFAKRETLPPRVCGEYDALEERIASLS